MGTFMKKFSAALVCATAALAMVPAANAGGSLDISLSDDVARIGYDATQMGSGIHISLAGLYDDDKGEMVSAGLHVVDVRPSTSNLYIGVGANVFAKKKKTKKTKTMNSEKPTKRHEEVRHTSNC